MNNPVHISSQNVNIYLKDTIPEMGIYFCNFDIYYQIVPRKKEPVTLTGSSEEGKDPREIYPLKL